MNRNLVGSIYGRSSFRPDPLTNMAATGDSCFWLADFKNLSPLKLFGQMYRNLHRCILQSFGTFGQAVSEEKIFKNRPIRNKNCLWWPCLLTDQNDICNRNRGLFIDASYQVSVHLAKQFQRRQIFKISQSETRIVLKIFSETPQPNELKPHLWKVLSKSFIFCPDPLTNMATTGNSCFWLADAGRNKQSL
jgi:hypothetical protein